ncbi:hypothetical protein HA402_004790 [Bradysia odoriphaga]|nr:hypothetical protein HA402_004790 [Bradysia odoriphaga]
MPVNITPEDFLAKEKEFLEILSSEENLKNIPLINHVNIQNLKDNSLVRFRGMVQDMLDPEFYLEKYAVGSGDSVRLQNGRYRDAFLLNANENVDMASPQNSHGERRSVFVVTIPGMNNWAVEAEQESCPIKDILPTEQVVGSSALKRPLEDEEPMESEKKSPSEAIGSLSNGSSVKESPSLLSREYLLNSPIADRPSKACIVKMYNDFDNLVLNTLVDVIGFLSVDAVLDGTNHDLNDFDDITEVQAANPPPSLIPRIHAILIKPITHLNPLLPQTTFDKITGFDDNTCMELFKDIQLLLTQCLLGDVVAAEYLMAHLISTVYVRSELECLGQFSLNLSNMPAPVLPVYTKLLYDIIEMILPASHYFPMTLDNLNLLQFSPKKDYSSNKLTSGLLQLAPHTNLVLDETQLQTGKLEASGVKAVSSIAYLINNQKVKCDFQYFDVEMNVNVPVLTLSEGKSMLPTNCHLPLVPQQESIDLINETFEAAKFFLLPKLDSIRRYLTILRIVKFNMNPDELTIIENDFVEMRREHGATPDDLHALIVLSRLIALCRGKTSLTGDLWQHAKSLEAERRKRIASIPTRS